MESVSNPGRPARIAMWSGPRNISTAMLRAFEARGDCAVTDEPLYAFYLDRTGLEHPGREAILASQARDWRAVAEALTGPVPDDQPVWYQKHMAHHLLPEVGAEWLDDLRHGFLIREPEAMLTSLLQVLPEPRLEDTGLPQQVALFDRFAATGETPPVVDSRDVLLDPPGMLAALCERFGIAYTEHMLTWAPGRRATDGVWAEHWYASVERSTGFAPYTEKQDRVPEHLEPLLEQCRPLYAHLAAHRLQSRTDA
ncbi:MAG: sulfotransferase-like domain-containing protein [Planctomycetota bacterium]|jgi:hypothetical protein